MIPNIVKGKGITGAIRYNLGEGNEKGSNIRKELSPGAISRAEILGGQNFGFDIDSAARVEIARRIMEFNGAPENQNGRTKKCRLDCLHASLSWSAGENPTPAEMREAAQSFLKALGMEQAQAIYFAHHDTNQKHIHIVASRIDPLTGKAFSDTRDRIAAQAWGVKWEREHGQISEARQSLHRLVNAVKSQDWPGLANALTERNPTFSVKELDRALAYAGCDEMQAARFRAKILADRSVIGLREKAADPITRYTTRDVLAAEREILRDTKELAATDRHGTRFDVQRDAADYHQLTSEQADALFHATQPGGFAMIAGQAGTGKSRAMAAIRDTYETEGFQVVGLGWTNSVAEDMRAKGFGNAQTISAALGLREGADRSHAPAAQWHDKTVVMVDEAAMLATTVLAALTQRARESGAKLILTGDDKQLGSIERGGMFVPLRHEHGAAEINEVQRVTKESEREAWGSMHKGAFGPALEQFDKQGALHWSKDAGKAEADLAKQYTADAKADPNKSRFIFAHTNEQVDRLNGLARGLAREAGKLGDDHTVPTKDGPQAFATGDRIQFTGNGQSRQGKEAGFVNGAVGTVTGIEVADNKAKLSVQLDNGKAMSFAVGDGKGEFCSLRHGYAGTIHKGQGRTIDQTYVLVSKGWQAQASYVAMTRHRESVSVHIPRDVASDVKALAGVMGRDDAKQAASGYYLDPAVAKTLNLDKPAPRPPAGATAEPPHPQPAAQTAQPKAAATPPENQPRDPAAESGTKAPPPKAPPGQQARSATEAGPAAAPGTDQAKQQADAKATAGKARKSQQARSDREPATPAPRGPDKTNRSAETRATARQAEKAGQQGASAAQSSLRGAAKVAEKALDALASIFESFGNEGPTPEERIENAKHDAERAHEQAQDNKVKSDQERQAREAQDKRDFWNGVSDTMQVMFPAETREERRMREEEEKRERDDDRGRERER